MSNEGNWGNMLGKMLKDQVGGEARPAGFEGTLRLGDSIVLRKRSMNAGATSEISAGELMKGTLMEKIEVGKSLMFGTGNTSPIRSIRSEGDMLIVETQTSTYEVMRPGAKTSESKAEVAAEPPKQGDRIRLTKRSLEQGQQSAIRAGEVVGGTLMKEIVLGDSVYFGTGNTSPVKAMRLEGGKIIVETQTSVYEIEKVK